METDRNFVETVSAALKANEKTHNLTFSLTHVTHFPSLALTEKREVCNGRYEILIAYTEVSLFDLLSIGPCVPTAFYAFSQLAQPQRDALLAPHRRWLTGFDTYVELHEKRLDILRRAYPNLKRIGVILDAADAGRNNIRSTVMNWSKRNNVEIVPIDVGGGEIVSRQLCCKFDAFYVPLSGDNWQNRKRLLTEIVPLKIPSIVEAEDFLKFGATISYQVDRSDGRIRVAAQISQLATGISAERIPIEGVRAAWLTVNLPASRLLKFRLDPKFIMAADRVIR